MVCIMILTVTKGWGSQAPQYPSSYTPEFTAKLHYNCAPYLQIETKLMTRQNSFFLNCKGENYLQICNSSRCSCKKKKFSSRCDCIGCSLKPCTVPTPCKECSWRKLPQPKITRISFPLASSDFQ